MHTWTSRDAFQYVCSLVVRENSEVFKKKYNIMEYVLYVLLLFVGLWLERWTRVDSKTKIYD